MRNLIFFISYILVSKGLYHNCPIFLLYYISFPYFPLSHSYFYQHTSLFNQKNPKQNNNQTNQPTKKIPNPKHPNNNNTTIFSCQGNLLHKYHCYLDGMFLRTQAFEEYMIWLQSWFPSPGLTVNRCLCDHRSMGYELIFLLWTGISKISS